MLRETVALPRAIPTRMSPPDSVNGPPPHKNGTSAQMRLDDLFGDAAPAEPSAPARGDALTAIALRLKWARETAGHDTASAAALAFGWAPSRYLAHESGERAIPSKQVAVYAAAFGIDGQWLQAGIGAPRSVQAEVRKSAAGAQIQARGETARPSEAMLRAARQAIFRIAVERGLVPATVPADQALALTETWRELADAAVAAAWAARG